MRLCVCDVLVRLQHLQAAAVRTKSSVCRCWAWARTAGLSWCLQGVESIVDSFNTCAGWLIFHGGGLFHHSFNSKAVISSLRMPEGTKLAPIHGGWSNCSVPALGQVPGREPGTTTCAAWGSHGCAWIWGETLKLQQGERHKEACGMCQR